MARKGVGHPPASRVAAALIAALAASAGTMGQVCALFYGLGGLVARIGLGVMYGAIFEVVVALPVYLVLRDIRPIDLPAAIAGGVLTATAGLAIPFAMVGLAVLELPAWLWTAPLGGGVGGVAFWSVVRPADKVTDAASQLGSPPSRG